MATTSQPVHSFKHNNSHFTFVTPKEYQFSFALSTQAEELWQKLTFQLCSLNIASKSKDLLQGIICLFNKLSVQATIAAKAEAQPCMASGDKMLVGGTQPDELQSSKTKKDLTMSSTQEEDSSLSSDQDATDSIVVDSVENDVAVVAKPSASFLDLPPEIRNEIYGYLLSSPVPIKPQLYKLMHVCLPEENQIFPAITRVNTQIRQETLEFLYARSTFHFPRGRVDCRNAPWQYARHLWIQSIKPSRDMSHQPDQWYPIFTDAVPWEKLKSLHTLSLEVKLTAGWAKGPEEIVQPIVQILMTILESINMSKHASDTKPNEFLQIKDVTYVSGWHGKVDWASSGDLRQGTVCVSIIRDGAKTGDRKYLWPGKQLCKHRGSKWKVQKGNLGVLDMEMTWIYPVNHEK